MFHRIPAGRRLARPLALAAGSAALLLFAAAPAGATTFSSAVPIAIPGGAATSGNGSVYPSAIGVSGLTGGVEKATVTLTGFAHQCSIDTDFLLVGPGGQSSILMSDAGDCANEKPLRKGVNLTFDEGAPTSVPCLDYNSAPSRLPTGTYRPTDYSPRANGVQSVCDPSSDLDHHSPPPPKAVGPLADVFSGLTRPLGGWGHTLDVFNNTDPNGAWLLYVTDQYSGSRGVLAGWTLNIATSPTPVPTPVRAPQLPNIAAKLSTSAFKSAQKVLRQGGVRAVITSSVAGSFSATGTVKPARTFKFTPGKANLVARRRTAVMLKLSSAGLKAVGKALAAHRKLTAKIGLTVTTATGIQTNLLKTVKLVS